MKMENDQVLKQVEALFSVIDSLPESLRGEALKKIESKLGQNKTNRKSGRTGKKIHKAEATTSKDEPVQEENEAPNESKMEPESDPGGDGDGGAENEVIGGEEELIKLCESDGIQILHCYSEAPEAENDENKKKSKRGRNLQKRRKFVVKVTEVDSATATAKPQRKRRLPKKLLDSATELGEDEDEEAEEAQADDETAVYTYKVPSGVKPSQVSVDLKELKRNKEGRRVKGQRTIYGCTTCSRKFHSKSMVLVHMRVHTGEKPHKCHICDKAFSQRGALNIHVRRHEKQYSFSCDQCDYKAVAKVDFIRHIARHSGEKNFSCEYCGKGFITDSSLKDHLKHVHQRSIIHHCQVPDCGFTTHRADNLKRHLLVKHSNKEYLLCPICSEFIKQRGTFITHLRTHTGERPHKCPEADCDKRFKSLSQVAAHARIHRQGTFTCDFEQCNRIFKTRFHLTRHKVVHTGEKPFKCDFCDYCCNVKGNINKHVRLVHGIKDFSFKAQHEKAKIKDVSHLGLEEKDANEVLTKGKAIAEEFLKNLSIRKHENLTVEELKRAVELKKSQRSSSGLTPPLKKSPKTAKKKVKKSSDASLEDENETAMSFLKGLQNATKGEEEAEEVAVEEAIEVEAEEEEMEGQLIVMTTDGVDGEMKEGDAIIIPSDATYICLNGKVLPISSEALDETQTYYLSVVETAEQMEQ